jgi:predicted metalloendopeptidase
MEKRKKYVKEDEKKINAEFSRETQYTYDKEGRVEKTKTTVLEDPHYVDWGCGSCFWIMFIIFVLFLFGSFFIIWYVPSPNVSKFPDTTLSVNSGESGEPIPGLGTVKTVFSSQINVRDVETDCESWETFNVTSHLCQPRLIYPVAVDDALIDRGVNQCDSFYDHVCGSWVKAKTKKLSPGSRMDRSFGYVQRHNKFILDYIIDRSDTGPIFNFYQSCVNALVQKQQREKEQQYVNFLLTTILEPIVDISDLADAFSKLLLIGFTTPISISIEEHPMEPIMIPFFGNDGFRGMSVEKVQKIFALKKGISQHEISTKTDLFITLNSQIEFHRPNDDEVFGNSMKSFVSYLRGPDFVKDTAYVDDVLKIMRVQFGISKMMRNLGLTTFPAYHVSWIRSKVYYRWLFGSFGPIHKANLEQWKAYVEFSILYSTVDYFPHLPSNVFFKNNNNNNRLVKRGMTSMKKRMDENTRITHEDCRVLTQELLPGFVSKKFIQLVGDDELYKEVEDMSEKIRKTFLKMIQEDTTSWMTEKDRKWTIQKIQNIIIRVGQPHVWKEEPFGDQILPNDYQHNLDYIRRYRVQRQFDRWNPSDNHQLDRDSLQRFNAPLDTVNAMYSPTSNTLTLFAGILQFPFIHKNFDMKSKYATIGTVIGHELGHAVDPLGRFFNKDGTFNKERNGWWHKESVDKYNEAVLCLITEYSSPILVNPIKEKCPTILTGENTNEYGTLTITEDFSDDIGLKMAYKTYFDNSQTPITNDDQQSFLYSFGQMWCSISTPEYECKKIMHDVHAIPIVRVNSAIRLTKVVDGILNCPKDTFMNLKNKCNVIF